MSGRNYKQIFANKDKATRELLAVCPNICHRSGIYFLLREDVDGKYGYIGKSETSLLERMASHLTGYQQHIDISLKKRGFYSEDNPSGWKLNVLFYPRADVDRWERHWIEVYRNAGYSLYNVESGGTDGKTIIGERKPPKTYREGVAYGRKSLAKELRHIVNTHDFIITPRKLNKVTEKALDKFLELLNFENEKGENNNEN
jgi:hypothetical protein